MDRLTIFVGLGNPGKQYKNTRHNVGFIVLENFLGNLQDLSEIKKDYKFNSIINEFILFGSKVVCVFPLTYMNLSGVAVKQIINYYRVSDVKRSLVVINDDMDVDLGYFKLRMNGGDGGHNGVRSIIDHVGKDFCRIKVGISRPVDKNYKEYVLQNFSDEEIIRIKEILPTLSLVLKNIIKEGFVLTMSKVGTFLIKKN
ncbi:MAG: aminoacyl-tRNA hydrolase [Candidatus Calescibacterium sp.]|nr:aminoacyl-tRNA hydrolase [Candidatus Calescibacterium sp.]